MVSCSRPSFKTFNCVFPKKLLLDLQWPGDDSLFHLLVSQFDQPNQTRTFEAAVCMQIKLVGVRSSTNTT